MFVCSVCRPNLPQACGRCCFQGPQEEGRVPSPFQMWAWPSHTLQGRWATGLQSPRRPHCMWCSAGRLGSWRDLSLVSPSLPERVRLALLEPQARGSQLGSAWETSSCWLRGLRLRIETPVLMPRAWGLSRASPWTTSDKGNHHNG